MAKSRARQKPAALAIPQGNLGPDEAALEDIVQMIFARGFDQLDADEKKYAQEVLRSYQQESPQMRNSRVMPHHGKGGDWRFKRRDPMHDILARPSGTARTGTISPRQRNAASDLLDAWESKVATGSTAWLKPYVDGTPDTSEKLVATLDAEAHYRTLISKIPEDCLYAIHVIICLQYRLNEYASSEAGQEIAKEQLGRGLTALADFLRY